MPLLKRAGLGGGGGSRLKRRVSLGCGEGGVALVNVWVHGERLLRREASRYRAKKKTQAGGEGLSPGGDASLECWGSHCEEGLI